MINILLINPAHMAKFKGENRLFFPLTQLTLASYIKDNLGDVFVKIIDLELESRYGFEIETLLNREDREYDLVGISDHYTNFCGAIDVARLSKRIFKKSNVVLGGVHASVNYKEILNNFSFVDGVVRGEGEHAFIKMIKNIKHGKKFSNNVISLMSRKKELNLIANNKKLLDLLTVGPVDYSLINVERYSDNKDFSDYQWVESGRGCSQKCKFCSSWAFWGGSARRFSPKKIVSEINQLKKYGINNFMFTHDDMLNDKKTLSGFCDYIGKIDKINWSCYSKAIDLDCKTIKKISSARCSAVFVGFETINYDIQKNIGKKYDHKKLYSSLKCLKKYKIVLNGNFIVNLPGATVDSINQDFSFALSLKIHGHGNIQFSPFKMFPGSVLFNKYNNNENIIYNDLPITINEKNKKKYGLLYPFAIKQNNLIGGVGAYAIAEIASTLLEYYPYVTQFLVQNSDFSLYKIIKSIRLRDDDKDMLSRTNFDEKRMFEIIRVTYADLCKSSQFLSDLFDFETSINVFTFSNNMKSVQANLTYKVEKYLDSFMITKHRKRHTYTFKNDGDVITIERRR